MDPEQESYAASGVEAFDVVDTAVGPPVRPWLTMGLTLVAMITYVVATTAVVVVFLFVEFGRDLQADIDAWVEQAETSGDLLSAGTWAGTIVVVPLVLFFARIVSGPFAREHLGFRIPSAKSLVQWILLALVFIAASAGLTLILGRESDWIREMYAATRYPVLLCLTLVIAAPVGEELLFRGFLFDGLARSRVGPIAAAVIASLTWASVHIQYDMYGIGTIFIGGLLLAAARHFTRSVIPCIAMHAVLNLVSILEVVLLD